MKRLSIPEHGKDDLMQALAIAYHDVLGEDEGSTLPPDVLLYCLQREDFHSHLEAIRRVAPTVATVWDRAAWGKKRPLFLTFDDGGISALWIATDLERLGWRGHFFITTDWIGKSGFLNERQIQDLHARGHVIGSHSCSHPARMSRLSWGELISEWTRSCDRLSRIVGERITAASVPDGYHSRKVAVTAAQAGVRFLFTSEPTSRVEKLENCFVLGRYSVMRNTPAAVSESIAAGGLWARWRQTTFWAVKKAAKVTAGKQYLRLRQLLLSRTSLGPKHL